MAEAGRIGTGAARAEPPEALLLAAGCTFEGLVVVHRAARIEGCVRGRVLALRGLEVAAGAQVEGDLDADSLVVAGRVRGVIRARSRVELCATAVVEGEIHAPGVSIAEGCQVDARCRVDADARVGPSPAAERSDG